MKRAMVMACLVSGLVVGFGAGCSDGGYGGGDEAGDGSGAASAGGASGGEAVGMSGSMSAGVAEGSRVIEARGVVVRVPEGWEMVQPSSGFRAAEFVLDAPADGSEGLMPGVGAVFTDIGGGLDGNVSRWRAQFVDPSDADLSTEERTVEGKRMVVFEGRGTYDEGRAMGSTGPKAGFAVFAFAVETDGDKPVFVKITGPAETLDAHAETWARMVDLVSVASEDGEAEG